MPCHRLDRCQRIAGWLALRVAVLTYDKRGVGQSEGSCCPYTDSGYFPLLAQDVLAGAGRIAQHPEVRADLIGLFGFSQGGWVVLIAAAEAPTGLRSRWSDPARRLVGEDCSTASCRVRTAAQASGLPPEEIERALTNAGPSGFDPRPYLERMTRPGLWIYGGRDLSIPVDRSVRRLDRDPSRPGPGFHRRGRARAEPHMRSRTVASVKRKGRTGTMAK